MASLTARFAQQAKRLSEKKEPVSESLEAPHKPVGIKERPVLTQLPLAQIHPDPNQPRRNLGDLSGLTDSITQLGVVQPIIVTVSEYESYKIVAGERRYTAAKAAGLTTIPAIVRTVEEQERLAVQLIENLHRKDLDPFEEAHSYQRLMEELGFTQNEIAKRLGKTQGSVSEVLRLLDLPEAIQSSYNESVAQSGGRITKSLLLEIAKTPPVEQTNLWESAKRGELTVKQARAQKKPSAKQNASTTAFGETKGTTFRYPIQTSEAMVTIVFDKSKATFEEIVAALEEALEGERAHLDATR